MVAMVLPQSSCQHRCDINVQAKWWWKCRILDWGKYLTRSLCWKRDFDFDWKIFWDTSFTDLMVGFPSLCLHSLLTTTENVHLPTHAYARQTLCLCEHQICSAMGRVHNCWNYMAKMEPDRRCLTSSWYNVSSLAESFIFRWSQPCLFGYIYVRMRSPCFETEF